MTFFSIYLIHLNSNVELQIIPGGFCCHKKNECDIVLLLFYTSFVWLIDVYRVCTDKENHIFFKGFVVICCHFFWGAMSYPLFTMQIWTRNIG